MGCYIEFLILKEKILEIAGEEISMPVTVHSTNDKPPTASFLSKFSEASALCTIYKTPTKNTFSYALCTSTYKLQVHE